jgi:hypothetical protein
MVQPVVQMVQPMVRQLNELNDELESDDSYICPFCGATFTDNSNKHRHMKYRCIQSKNNSNNNSNNNNVITQLKEAQKKIEELEKKQLLTEMKALEEKTKLYEEKSNRLEIELDRRDRQIENMNDVTMSSMSALNYAIKYCPDAPLLSSIPQLTLKCIGDTDDEIIDRVLYKQQQGILTKYANNALSGFGSLRSVRYTHISKYSFCILAII